MERAFHDGGPRWWDNSALAQKIGLNDDQKKQMDSIFQEHRLKLIDLMANVKKQEVILEPLISADQPDEGRILGQIDKVAQGRADLEKANARMLLGIRRVLTPDQWKKLQADRAAHRMGGRPSDGGGGSGWDHGRDGGHGGPFAPPE